MCACREKVVVPASKPYVTFQGAGRDVTVVEWHDRASDRGADGQPLRTYNTASVTILANYFNAKNISFKVSSSRMFAYSGVHERTLVREVTRRTGEKGVWPALVCIMQRRQTRCRGRQSDKTPESQVWT